MPDCDIINEPIKFLGATVLSFNSSLGLGSVESTLNVDLIEDCDAGDYFLPVHNQIYVGAPVFFSAGEFKFGGILTNWTASEGSSGKTFNVKVSDPRQLLENTAVVTDSYVGPPTQGLNYYNAFAFYEKNVIQNNDCDFFGTSLGDERGMPYQRVIYALINMCSNSSNHTPNSNLCFNSSPIIFSTTGYRYIIDFTTFPQNLPEYYRVSGPSITLLQLLQDVCDVMGFDFYVYLDAPTNSYEPSIIRIGLIDLKLPVASFETLISSYSGLATERSYGQELRNEITKTVLFGEYQHYLSQVNKFNYFFGEDLVNNTYVPVVPYKYDSCGFWINKMVDSLNLQLSKPLPSNGPYTIHELDIRSAMVSQELWKLRTMSPSISGSFNQAIRDNWPEAVDDTKKVIDSFGDTNNTLGIIAEATGIPPISEMVNQPNENKAYSNLPEVLEDIEKVWNFIKSLGDTYYGKQFITPLDQLVCYRKPTEEEDPKETIFSDIPTNAGGWVDYGTTLLGLAEPELSFFREEDGRISCFALFNFDGQAPSSSSSSAQSSSFGGDPTVPTNPISSSNP